MPDDPKISTALSPVHDHPDDPEQPSDGIALCMSGGGYRAMLFHLGSLWRLNELRYLPKLDMSFQRVRRLDHEWRAGYELEQARVRCQWICAAIRPASDAAHPQHGVADGGCHLPFSKEFLARRIKTHRRPLQQVSVPSREAAADSRTLRVSFSTRRACRRACCGGSPSPTWATGRLGWSGIPASNWQLRWPPRRRSLPCCRRAC